MIRIERQQLLRTRATARREESSYSVHSFCGGSDLEVSRPRVKGLGSKRSDYGSHPSESARRSDFSDALFTSRMCVALIESCPVKTAKASKDVFSPLLPRGAINFDQVGATNESRHPQFSTGRFATPSSDRRRSSS